VSFTVRPAEGQDVPGFDPQARQRAAEVGPAERGGVERLAKVEAANCQRTAAPGTDAARRGDPFAEPAPGFFTYLVTERGLRPTTVEGYRHQLGRFEDYLEADTLLPALEQGRLGPFDVVLHMGACSSTTETDAAYLIRNNYEYTKRLAEWSLGTGARFVYASSAATYGDGSAGLSDLDASVEALTRLRPLNMYGYSKHLFDLHAARQGLLDRIVGLKYFNVFGPNEDHKGDMRSLVQKAYHQVRETGRIQLFRSHRPDYAHGEQRRDFLYVKDAVEITLHLAARRNAAGLFNVGSGVAHTWLELAGALFSALGKEPVIDFVDMPESIRAKYQYYTRAELRRLQDHGFDGPVTSLDGSVADYVLNYLVPGVRLGEEAGAT
jgi:ADP-L-glycero-D-manno-heptose 6-epimerase